MAAEEASEMPRPRGSDRYASGPQRGRLLSATFALVGEKGYEGVTARSVSERAGMSNRTFYEVFSDREDCFLAAKAWRLTADGEAVIDAHGGGRELIRAQRKVSKGGKLVAPKRGRRGTSRQIAATGSDAVNVDFRMTALAGRVLTAVSELSARGTTPSNREIAIAAKVKDQGQISRLLARLQTHGLLQNTGGHPAAANAWRLTERGAELLAASRPSREGAGR
jgi:AcrR family transcriptional regulator